MDNSFKDFVLEQLGALDVDAKPMFGGFGLYDGDRFFGIVYRDRLYFKTDDASRARYVKLGMGSFTPNERQTLKNYLEVPPEVIEDRVTLVEWAEDAAAIG